MKDSIIFIGDLCCGTVLVRKINYLSRRKAVVLLKVLCFEEFKDNNLMIFTFMLISAARNVIFCFLFFVPLIIYVNLKKKIVSKLLLISRDDCIITKARNYFTHLHISTLEYLKVR